VPWLFRERDAAPAAAIWLSQSGWAVLTPIAPTFSPSTTSGQSVGHLDEAGCRGRDTSVIDRVFERLARLVEEGGRVCLGRLGP
jgi:hypothetical protein